jgi:hypothetical protein
MLQMGKLIIVILINKNKESFMGLSSGHLKKSYSRCKKSINYIDKIDQKTVEKQGQ